MFMASAYQAHGVSAITCPMPILFTTTCIQSSTPTVTTPHLHHPRRQLATTGIDNNFVRHPRKAVSGSVKTCLSCGTGWGNGASCIGACVQMRWAGAIGNADWRLGLRTAKGLGTPAFLCML